MAFRSKLSGLVRGNFGGNNISSVIAPNMHMFNAVRCLASKLFVGGLSWGTDENTLRSAFESYGEVTEAIVINDRETGRSRGFGFVNYTTDESASKAVSGMDGQELDGRQIRVNIANDRPPRDGGFGGYGGGGGGYGGGGGGGY